MFAAVVNREALLAALRLVVPFTISTRPPVPVLAGVRLTVERGGVTVCGFDYEHVAVDTVPCDGGKGDVLVNGRMLARMVGELPAGCNVTLRDPDSKTLAITVGDRVDMGYRIPTLPLEEYPAVPDVRSAVEVATFNAAGFLHATAPVAACGRDDTLPVLTGVLIELPPEDDEAAAEDGLTFAATDRYRLAVTRTGVPGTFPGRMRRMLVPRAAVLAARSAFRKETAPIVVACLGDGNHGEVMAVFRCGSRILATRLLDGEFPKWRPLVDKPTTVATIHMDRDRTIDALRRVSVVIARNLPAKLLCHASGIKFQADNGTVAEFSDGMAGPTAWDSVATEHEGEDVTIAFSPDYLDAGLRMFGAKITMRVTNPAKPAILTSPDSPGLTYLLMPVRLANR